jgi:DNA-binding NarL/FixJ family response regulator
MTAWPVMTRQTNSFSPSPAEPGPGSRPVKQPTTSASGLDRQTIAHIQSNVSLAQQSLNGDDLALAAEYLSQAVQLLGRVAPAVTPAQPSPKAQPQPDSRLSQLSDREREVLQLLAQGKSAPVISKLLHLSVTTIYTYHQRIKAKLNLHDLPSLTRFALDQQLVT